ncbi:MAG TPA: hypothetical protein VMH77_00090 [Steroidobacteraceae bacterium]|nr:hypothetical protein [Steroidobacteraceae bacterium]
MNTRTIALLLGATLLGGCVDAPFEDAPFPDRRADIAAPEPVNQTKVYFYPTQGQSEAQQDRDRFECHEWAVKQTGFDPTQHGGPALSQAVVPARTPGETVGAAAVVGAVLGAALAGPGHMGGGAAFGAVAGTMAGTAQAANDQAAADAVNDARNARSSRQYEHAAAEYRRAMTACLTGRGYSVR